MPAGKAELQVVGAACAPLPAAPPATARAVRADTSRADDPSKPSPTHGSKRARFCEGRSLHFVWLGRCDPLSPGSMSRSAAHQWAHLRHASSAARVEHAWCAGRGWKWEETLRLWVCAPLRGGKTRCAHSCGSTWPVPSEAGLSAGLSVLVPPAQRVVLPCARTTAAPAD